jgi:nitrite reductase (NO-forming)
MNGMWAKIREWFVLVVGLAVIVGGLSITSYIQSLPAPAPDSVTASSEQPTSKPAAPQQQAGAPQPATPQQAAPSKQAAQPAAAQGAAKPAPAVAPAAANSKAAAAPAAAPAHNHTAAPATAPVATPATHNHAAAAPQAVAQIAAGAPAAAPSAAASSAPALDAQAAAGQRVYRKCQACHSLEAGKNGLGPSLAGIVGQKAAEVPRYNFSPAMKASGLTWDVATLDRYLADPQKVVPGNKMPFPGLKTENERSAVIAYLVATSAAAAPPAQAAAPAQAPARAPAPASAPQQAAPPAAASAGAAYLPGIRYTLRTGIAEGRMVFIGVGGTIDGQINPLLSAAEGQVVQVTLINGEGAEHDIVFEEQGPAGSSPHIVGRGASTNIAFVAGKAGDYAYFCSIPGHRLAGMAGQFLITPQPPAQTVVEADISLQSTEVPPPIGKREPQTVRVDLVTVELEGRLAEGTTFGYWTFNGKVPGPMLRVRVGDTVEVHLKNAEGSGMVHSVDFHAVTGPGGGAASTQANPGETKTFKFKALAPGLYVYHCATPMVAHHIANGMYGLILVEPEGGLPPVDREFYVMQGEIYTAQPFGQHGSLDFDVEKLLAERPEYFVFNGSVGALSKLHPLQAKVGETVRFFFGVGGPNFTSSFHLIGEIFDKVYNLGGVLSEPLRGIQTVTVPPGGAVITEAKLDVPGNYTLVDHALSRAERGLVGILHVEGTANPDIYDGAIEPGH